jgi:hypothetical protein
MIGIKHEKLTSMEIMLALSSSGIMISGASTGMDENEPSKKSALVIIWRHLN